MTPPSPLRASWLSLRPEAWRIDLLRIVLRISAIFGGLVFVPSAFFALKAGMYGVVALDTVVIGAIVAIDHFDRIPARARAAAVCVVTYGLGTGLLVSVGPIGQIYLLGFSLFTTLLLGLREGLLAVVLAAITSLVVGYVGLAAPGLVAPHWVGNNVEWSVIVSNYVLVDASVVLTLGAVVNALESAHRRAVAAREALEREQTELVKLNESLGLEVRERTRSEESLRESRALLRIAGRTARLGGWRVDRAGTQLVWSDEACELHGVPAGTTLTAAEAIASYTPEWRDILHDAVERCGRDGTAFDLEAELFTASQARIWVRVIGIALRDAEGVITHVHGSVQDITPQKLAEARHAKLEDQFRQAQKMETVGSLAGGVAHDFNNLMSVVLSYSDLIDEELRTDDPIRRDLAEIRAAGMRAVELTRQLLAFSRQQVLEPKIVDLGAIVAGTENMLRRLLGEDVELSTRSEQGLAKILVDPGQMEQVIMNLAVNARDAMPGGGKLTIETTEVQLDEGYASEHVGVTAGPHVMLAVSDSGTGMDHATQARMFEPFFTTKEQGKGTGLGLATVFGIVQQSGGTIWVYSELGQGTTFKVYFPRAAGLLAAPALAEREHRPTDAGSETILLVEDDERLRVLARTILRKHGYHVLEAENAGAALLACDQHGAPIHLLLTDVVMPRMSGRQLVERLLPLRPAMKVLYMSGYTDDAVVRHGILDSTVAFLQKPVTPATLARKVREVLDAPPRMAEPDAA